MNEQRTQPEAISAEIEEETAAMVKSRPWKKERFWENRAGKVGLLVLALQILIFLISGVIGERNRRSQQATDEIASKWGREQKIVGPVLTVPYERRVEQEKEGKKIEIAVIEYARFLAEELLIDAQVDSSLRHRGIFELPVYRMKLALTGRFHRPDFTLLGIEPSRIFWDRASLGLLISDPRSVSSQVDLLFNEEKLEVQPLSSNGYGGGRTAELLLPGHS